jgi:hypothetical protein
MATALNVIDLDANKATQLLGADKAQAIWYTGESRSGKTQQLVEAAVTLLPQLEHGQQVLLLAANDENKQNLHDRISIATTGHYPLRVQTPLGFLQEQVHLFYPWIAQAAQLPAVTPIRLRPETEQALATRLWQPELQMQSWQQLGVTEYRLVRRLLDLMQLAANGMIEVAAVPDRLQLAYGSNDLFPWMGDLISTWQSWCLERGLLTYGLSTDLFWRYLWNHGEYRAYFNTRYGALIADDADDYPAVIYPVLESFLEAPAPKPIVISYNPHGQIQLGLKSDPQHLLKLLPRCTEVNLPPALPALQPQGNLLEDIVMTVNDPSNWLSLPPNIQEISRRTRGELLRAVVDKIAMSIASHQIQPQEIVIIVPGLDNIARYTLTESLAAKGIAVKALNDQRPLYSSPAVRAILTILALSLPGLGRTIGRDRVAEMLVELSSYRLPDGGFASAIDPVRAGLLADHCYSPNAEKPELQPLETFLRWDRLGARAAASYRRIWQWLQSPPATNALGIMDGAIGEFCERGELLTFDRLTALRALMETAQHYWQVMQRVDDQDLEASLAEQFILLLQQGTVTANPYPTSHLGAWEQGVTLANIFQYRSSKKTHRWHFWLDVGSELWAKGGSASLYGSHCFLQDWDGQPITAEVEELLDRQRLERVLRDLLQRVDDRLYLCNSDLAVNGQDQVGSLLTLISRITPEIDPMILISATGIETHAF